MEKATQVWVGGQRSEGLPLQGPGKGCSRARGGHSLQSCHPTLKHTPKPCSYLLCAHLPYVHGSVCLVPLRWPWITIGLGGGERGLVAELTKGEKVRAEMAFFLKQQMSCMGLMETQVNSLSNSFSKWSSWNHKQCLCWGETTNKSKNNSSG